VMSNPPDKIEPVGLESCKEVSTKFLLDTLAAHYADASDNGKDNLRPEDRLIVPDLPTMPIVTISVGTNLGSPDELLPAKSVAKGWLKTFLGGPNLLFRMCDEDESWKLVDSIYTTEYVPPTLRCSIWLRLAAGCRLMPGTTPQSYIKLFESGCKLLEQCIEQADEVAPLWIVSALLHVCLCSMDSRPKSCWLTLGTAIRLAQMHYGDRKSEVYGSSSLEESGRWREVWRTMISFDA
jgi:hypothetical protein